MNPEASRPSSSAAPAGWNGGNGDAVNEQSLARSEAELSSQESSVLAEATKLMDAGGACAATLQRLREQVQRAHDEGVQDPMFGQLIERLKIASPTLDVSTPRELSLSARKHALEVRGRAISQMREMVKGFGAEVVRVTNQLAEEQVLLTQIEVRFQEEKARLAAVAAAPPPATEPVHVAPPPAISTSLAPPPAPPTAAVVVEPEPVKTVTAAPVAHHDPHRTGPRVRMQAVVDMHSETNFFTGFSMNISDGGLFVATVQTAPIGTHVDVSFTLPPSVQLSLKGVVRWVREVNDNQPDVFPGVGIQFAEMPAEAAEAIGKFIATREPMFYPD